jgi:hypothetical protein
MLSQESWTVAPEGHISGSEDEMEDEEVAEVRSGPAVRSASQIQAPPPPPTRSALTSSAANFN